MSPTTRAAAGAATRCGSSRRSIAAGVQGRAGRRDPRPGAGRRGAPARRGTHASPRASTATAATSSPSRSARRPWCARCATRRCADAAASMPTTRSTSARPRRCRSDGITVVVISNRFQCADPDVLRGIRPRHRRRARRGGEVARPFPRRLRRILPPRAGDRGRRARPDQPDPVALPLEAHAAPRAADRRRPQAGPRRQHEARRPADAVPGARPQHPAAQHRRHGTGAGAPRRAAAPAHEDREIDRRGAPGHRGPARRHHRLDPGGGGVFRRPRHRRHSLRGRHHAAEARSGRQAEQRRRRHHRDHRRSGRRGRDRRPTAGRRAP